MHNQFITDRELLLSNKFIESGYLIESVENKKGLERIQYFIAESASQLLGVSYQEPILFLNQIHSFVKPENLNELRIKIIHLLNQEKWFRPIYFSLAKCCIEAIVGNELAMQTRINLSIQMPGDDTSLLPIHADVWSGDSPYEVVLWVPLVDCFGTKAMYILPPKESKYLHENFFESSSSKLYENVKYQIDWINIKAGEFLLFNQNLPHGNIVNDESETRWSMNCRFKSIFSPYGDKKIGEFFEPITLKAASRIGMEYKFPKIKTGQK
jgi:sporadic carbohydrate cluster 2OG-Fe(II) oxygenase